MNHDDSKFHDMAQLVAPFISIHEFVCCGSLCSDPPRKITTDRVLCAESISLCEKMSCAENDQCTQLCGGFFCLAPTTNCSECNSTTTSAITTASPVTKPSVVDTRPPRSTDPGETMTFVLPRNAQAVRGRHINNNLFQRLSMITQRFNSVLIMDSFTSTDEDPDL